MTKMYVVKYSGGSYDDYYTDNIFVTDKKSKATKYVTKFNKLLKKWQKHYDQYCDMKFSSMLWLKDEHIQYFDRWNKLKNINTAYWEEIEVRN